MTRAKPRRLPSPQACLPVVRRGGVEYAYDARVIIELDDE